MLRCCLAGLIGFAAPLAAQERLPTVHEGDQAVLDGRTVTFASDSLQIYETMVRVGPRNGTLLLVGGGSIPASVWDQFALALGGRGRLVVVIPTGDCFTSKFGEDDRSMRALAEAGFTNLHLLHTRDRRVADAAAFSEILESAAGVWFGGGGTGCIMAPYGRTLVAERLGDLLARGGVIGGTSAGAMVLASHVEERIGQPWKLRAEADGFGFLRNAVIAPHIDARPVMITMLEDVIGNFVPGLLGIGIEEGTVAVIDGDCLRVAGSGQAFIYDGTAVSRGLQPGQPVPNGKTYDLGRRLPGSAEHAQSCLPASTDPRGD